MNLSEKKKFFFSILNEETCVGTKNIKFLKKNEIIII